MENEELTPSVITKYNDASRIAKSVYCDLIKMIRDGERNVRVLCDVGNLSIMNKVSQVYKNVKCKGIGFPVSISLDNCVGNYIYEEGYNEYNTINKNSVIKIELGVQIDGYCAKYADTFLLNDEHPYKYILDFLDQMHKEVPKVIQIGETTDDIRQFIESKCTDLDVFPVENTISHQQIRYNELHDTKKLILHHQKHFDQEDYEVTEPNLNYEMEEYDVYEINLTVIPDLDHDDLTKYNVSKTTSHVYIVSHEPHIYRFNGCYHDFKLKNTKKFATEIKERHFNYGFDYTYYKNNPIYKMGMKEALSSGVIEDYPVMYSKDKLPVFTKKFIVLVQEARTNVLK